MQEQGIVAFAKNVLVILEHDLTITVWMQERDDINVVHLTKEFCHVGAGSSRKQHKLEVDAQDFSFGKSHLVL